MTNIELIQAIRNEIERRIKILRENEVVRQNCTSDFLEGKIYGYEEVISILSTILSIKNTDIKMYDLGQLIEESKRQKQKEVLSEGGALIDANRLISRLDNLHGEYEKKFDKTGEVLFEQAIDVVEKVQRIVLDMKNGKKDG